MLIIQNTLVEESIIEKHFACDLIRCKGACCVEGESGAPLEKEEVVAIEMAYENIKPLLTQEGIESIHRHGFFVKTEEGLKTPLRQDGPCAYVTFENGIARCGIEKAWSAGKCSLQKPVSCHLYPIRIKQEANGITKLHYEKWHICKPACTRGENLKMPLYRFVKDALIRRFGEEFYKMLEATARYLKK